MISKRTWIMWHRPGSYAMAAKVIKFMLVGGTGLVVNTLVLYLLYQIGHLPLLVASVIAVEMAIVNNFVINNHWTFKQRELSPRRFLRFNVVSAGGLAITTGTLLLLENAGLYYLIANIAGVVLATAWNFALNVLWTWRW